MLCQFTVKNFKSYRSEATLDMRAANLSEFQDSLIVPEDPKLEKLLPIAALYGPNAGGKSNLIAALAYLISRVISPIGTSMGHVIPFKFGMSYSSEPIPFLFDDSSKSQPTEFEVFFRTGKAQYQYQLAVSKNAVLSESLFVMKMSSHRYNLLFEREGSQIRLGGALRRANTKNVGSTIPFLSFLAIGYEFPEIKDALSWFYDCCIVNFSIPYSDHNFYEALNDIKGSVLQLLSEMDIPISDYSIEKSEESEVVYTTHLVNGKPYQLRLEYESAGTLKILSVIVPMLASYLKGGLFIVDELDAKLHPQLLRYLISLYTDPEMNKERAQLVFTCHDLSIMSNEFLRRDEIWFAARGKDSGSELWSLADIQDTDGKRVKNTEAYDKRYLEGRYGADPYLRRIQEWGGSDA